MSEGWAAFVSLIGVIMFTWSAATLWGWAGFTLALGLFLVIIGVDSMAARRSNQIIALLREMKNER